MTVGQRIAHKRKESGLSQEALGEQLGVSRQAIYKWESDSSLPEIDKLIALSRIFSVPVGWLLGVEESCGESGASPEGDGELTPAQLAMVEEIVRRYQQAQPAPPPRKKWPRVLAVLILIFALFRLFSQLDSLQKNSAQMQGAIDLVNRQVENLTYSIPSRVEDVLEQMNNFTVEHSVEITSADLAANTVTFEVYAVPKTYTEGMTAFVQADCKDTLTATFPLSGDSTGYRGSLTCPLTDSISLSVTFVTGDKQETQKLQSYDGLYMASFPYHSISTTPLFMDLAEDTLPGGITFAVHPDNYAADKFFRRAQATQLRLGLFRDYQLVCWMEQLDEQPDSYRGDWTDHLFFLNSEDQLLDRSSSYCLALVVTDEYGREIVCPDIPVVYESDDWTWPDNSSMPSRDPGDWTY